MYKKVLQRCVIFLGVFSCFLLPDFAAAFEVSPSVIDVSFSQDVQEVEQIISVTNTGEHAQIYYAAVELVSFSPEGTFSSFSPVSEEDVEVFPREQLIQPGETYAFRVTFLHPARVTIDQVFGVTFYEKQEDVQKISGGFVALLFPELPAQMYSPQFRIDTFGVFPREEGFWAVVQFTNTGEGVVRPASVIVVRDFFGRVLAQSTFADYEGRLPDGVTRTLSEQLPFSSFGPWHLGGKVTFSLVSVATQGGEVQYASVVLWTLPGVGVLCVGGGVLGAFFFIAFFFVKKRRGILRA